MTEHRGKVPRGKDWIYGQLLELNDNYQIGLDDAGVVIVPRVGSCERLFAGEHYTDVLLREFYFVDPNTVGRNTGVELEGIPLYTGDIVRYVTCDEFEIDAEVKIGEYEQDGSGGEYGPVKCFGVYLEQIGFTRPDWAEEYGENPDQKYNTVSPLELMQYKDRQLRLIGNKTDNPELVGS